MGVAEEDIVRTWLRQVVSRNEYVRACGKRDVMEAMASSGQSRAARAEKASGELRRELGVFEKKVDELERVRALWVFCFCLMTVAWAIAVVAVVAEVTS